MKSSTGTQSFSPSTSIQSHAPAPTGAEAGVEVQTEEVLLDEVEVLDGRVEDGLLLVLDVELEVEEVEEAVEVSREVDVCVF
jgi:hypothetical protein